MRESIGDCCVGSFERGGVPEQQVVAVGLVEQGVDLEDQLTDIRVLRKSPLPLSGADVGLEQFVPAGEHSAHAVSDRPGAGVPLGGGGREEAAAREDAAFDVGQVALAQLL